MNPNSLIKYQIFLFISFLFSSCNNDNRNTSNTSHESLTEVHKSDTSFYKTGKVKVVIQKVNQIKNGWQYEYSEAGLLTNKAFYKDGRQYGLTYSYFPNGRIQSVGRWLNGRKFGDQTFYYENGKIEAFASYDFQEHCRYLEKFTQNGLLINESGTLLGQLMYEGNIDSIFPNQHFVMHVCIANPPFVILKTYVNDYDDKDHLQKRVLVNPVNNHFTVDKFFVKKGKALQLITCEIYSHENILLKVDTLKTAFDIK